MADKTYKKYTYTKMSDLPKLSQFVVLDVETTGLSANKDKIIEIAMVKVVDGAECDRFSSLVNPEREISSRITKLTGITNEALATAPAFPEIAKTVSDFIGDSVILAHNAPFDLGFVSGELSQAGITTRLTYLDTLKLARTAYPYLPDHKLETLITELGLADEQTHRAMDDVICTLELFRRICRPYASPLSAALCTCCAPMENFRLMDMDLPLNGKHLYFVGNFTFSYSAAKSLVKAAGGIWDQSYSEATDYLVFGYLDPIDCPPEQLDFVRRIKGEDSDKTINEVALLKMCGVSFT